MNHPVILCDFLKLTEARGIKLEFLRRFLLKSMSGFINKGRRGIGCSEF